MPRKMPHIPTRDEQERSTGHPFHYSREERHALVNAPGEHKRVGLRRFAILFFDVALLVGGIFVIKNCVGSTPDKKSATIQTVSGQPLTNGQFVGRGSVEYGKQVREIRLSIRRADGEIFTIETNAASADYMGAVLHRVAGGKTNRFPLQTVSAGTTLISHHFFYLEKGMAATNRARFTIRWLSRGNPGQTISIDPQK